MSCFFRIWKTSSFWCRDPSNNIVGLPLSVQAHLRKIALKGLHYLEGDVLKELDEILTQQVSPKSDGRIAVWASMWQLILMYRDLIVAFRSFLDRSQADSNSRRPSLDEQEVGLLISNSWSRKTAIQETLRGLLSPLDDILPLSVPNEEESRGIARRTEVTLPRHDIPNANH